MKPHEITEVALRLGYLIFISAISFRTYQIFKLKQKNKMDNEKKSKD